MGGGGGGGEMHISRAMTTTIRFSMCGSFAMNARGRVPGVVGLRTK